MITSEILRMWGGWVVFPCGHRAFVLGDHDMTHRHWCPVCVAKIELGCIIEYLDIHRERVLNG